MTEMQKFFAPKTPALPEKCRNCAHCSWVGRNIECGLISPPRLIDWMAPPPDWCPLRGAQ